mmetsp:Transcript_18569/g.49878  ORF Transcript_18569/g.49878 Transcript_18569/m.49878 type:complete len:271 (+) Transcript_18569:746-1558(+)
MRWRRHRGAQKILDHWRFDRWRWCWRGARSSHLLLGCGDEVDHPLAHLFALRDFCGQMRQQIRCVEEDLKRDLLAHASFQHQEFQGIKHAKTRLPFQFTCRPTEVLRQGARQRFSWHHGAPVPQRFELLLLRSNACRVIIVTETGDDTQAITPFLWCQSRLCWNGLWPHVTAILASDHLLYVICHVLKILRHLLDHIVDAEGDAVDGGLHGLGQLCLEFAHSVPELVLAGGWHIAVAETLDALAVKRHLPLTRKWWNVTSLPQNIGRRLS